MDDDPQTSQHGIRALWPRNLSKFDEIFKYLPNKNEWRKCMHLGNCRSQVKKRSKYEMTQALTIMRCDLNFHKWHPYCTLAMSGSVAGKGGYSGSWIWFEKIYLACFNKILWHIFYRIRYYPHNAQWPDDWENYFDFLSSVTSFGPN